MTSDLFLWGSGTRHVSGVIHDHGMCSVSLGRPWTVFAILVESALYSAESPAYEIGLHMILNLKETVSKAKAGIFVHIGVFTL